MILGNNEPTSNADVNEDGVVNVLDVVTLINIISINICNNNIFWI